MGTYFDCIIKPGVGQAAASRPGHYKKGGRGHCDEGDSPKWQSPPGQEIATLTAEYRLDEIPAFYRLGGAGIHFMTVHKRYRASFNSLEYPRVVVALKKKAGLVQDISYSTRQPDEVLRLIKTALSANPG